MLMFEYGVCKINVVTIELRRLSAFTKHILALSPSTKAKVFTLILIKPIPDHARTIR